MTRYGMLIDINKCNGCYNCFLACKDEFTGNDYPPFSLALPEASKPWLKVKEIERGRCPKVKVDYLPVPCQQCDTTPCIEKFPEGAVYMRDDGIVIIDPEKARGCKEIVNSCPYRVISWNEEKDVAQKCTFCAHLLDQGWKEPRCVEACPSGALVFGDLDDPDSRLSGICKQASVETLSPEFNSSPKVFYLGLPKKMIAGEVVLADKQDVCAENVEVAINDGSAGRTTKTDYLGDFVFEGLESNYLYTLQAVQPGYKKKEVQVKTSTDVNLGEIVLEPE
ncbi:MAG: hypothetical protein K9K82_07175 [Desulfobacteraceae bacterium]|nr:hypothetical protein [Desulfobacteraceae bacterium]